MLRFKVVVENLRKPVLYGVQIGVTPSHASANPFGILVGVSKLITLRARMPPPVFPQIKSRFVLNVHGREALKAHIHLNRGPLQ